MENGISKQERLALILSELCEGKQTILARKLGKSQQNMNSILAKGVWYDAVALKEAFPELSDEWLLTGSGEMIKGQYEPKEDDECEMYEVNGDK